MTPKVTVIIPAYNCEKYIDECIQSILNQTYQHFELLICDDGSTDSTVGKISEYHDPRIKLLINQKNLGSVNTLNKLFHNAGGQYIMLQDADDYSEPDRIELLLKAKLENPTFDVIGSHLVRINQNGEFVADPQELSPIRIEEEFNNYIIPKVTFGSLLITKEVANIPLRKLGFINRSEDVDWLFRVSELHKILIIDNYLYYYRQHDQSRSNNNKNETIYNMFYQKYITHIIKIGREEKRNLLEEMYSKELENYLKGLIEIRCKKDPVFWQRHLAYRAKKNKNYLESIYWAITGILKKPFNYGSYQCLKKVL